MIEPKRVPSWLLLTAYIVTVALLGGAIVHFHWPESLLVVLSMPCVALALYYRRRVYGTMLATLVAAAVWVTYLVSGHLVRSLVSIVLACLSAVVMAEMVRAVALARERAQQKLGESEVNFRAFFDAITDLIVVGAPDGHVLFANAAVSTRLGYTAAELPGMHMLDLRPAGLRAKAETSLTAAFRGERDECPLPLACRDGTLVPVETRVWMGRWNDGDCVFCVSKDLTAEQEAQQRLDLFFRQSLDGFFFMMLDEPVQWDDTVDKEQVLDYVFAHQRITRANDALLDQYRATREQFLGLTPAFFCACDLAHGRAAWRQLFDTGYLHLDGSERKLDGTPMDTERDCVCLYDAHGRISGHFGVQREVTAQRSMVRRLQDQEHFMSVLNDITRATLEPSGLQDVLQTLADRVGELFCADGCYLTLWDQETRSAIPMAAYGAWRGRYHQNVPQPGEPTLTAAVLAAGHPIAIEDVYDSSYLSPRIAGLYPDRSLLGLPLIVDDQKLGAALIAYNETHRFTPTEIARGELVAGQIALVVARIHALETERAQRAALQDALAQVRTLQGLLPICATCKKIRDDQGYWHQVEVFVRDHTGAEFSHGICPDCFRQLYPQFADAE